MKKIINLLRKLGVVRGGFLSWSGEAEDRPYAFIKGDIFNEDKELIHKKDIEDFKKTISKKPKLLTNIILWIIGIFCITLGLLMMFSYFLSGLLCTLVGVLTIPTLNHKITKKFKLTKKKTRLIFVILFIGFFATVMFGTNIPSYKKESESVPLKIIDAEIEASDDLIQSIANLINNYIDARSSMLFIYDINVDDMSKEEYQDYILLVSAKWQLVEDDIKTLETYIQNAPENIVAESKADECGNTIFLCAFAQGISIEDMVERPVSPIESNEWEEMDAASIQRRNDVYKKYREELSTYRKRNLRQAELIRKVHPEKGWLTAIAEAFETDLKSAEKIMYEIQTESEKDYKQTMSDIEKRQRAKYVAQTGLKIALYATSIPATGGASAAIGTFMGGVDIAVSIGDTVRIFKADENGLINFKDDTELIAPVMTLLSTQGFVKNVGEFGKTISKYGKDDVLYLNEQFMSLLKENENDEFVNVVELGDSGKPEVVYYNVPKTEMFTGGEGSGNEYLPPHLRAAIQKSQQNEEEVFLDGYQETLQKIRSEIGEEEWQKLMRNAKERAEKESIQSSEKEAERKAVEQEALRKEQEIQKIIEHNEARRELEKIEEEERVEKNSDKEIIETPSKETIKPKAESGQKVGDCNLCWNGGLDCVCGYDSCVCCAPGADCSGSVN